MGASSSKSSSKPVDMTPPDFKALQGPFANTLQDMLTSYNKSGDTQKLTNGYQGPYVAPLGGAEQQGLSQVQGLANNIGGGNAGNVNTSLDQLSNNTTIANGTGTGNIANYARTLMGANQNPTSYLNPASYMMGMNGASGGAFDNTANPFLQSAIQAAQRPTLEGLSETLSRDMPSMFARAGQVAGQGQNGSSAFDRAAAIATRGVANSLGDIGTNMSYSNYNDASNRSATALEQLQEQKAAANQQTQQLTSQQQQNAVTNSQQAQQANNQNAQTASGVQGTDINNAVTNLQSQALPRLIQDLGIERGTEAFNNNINSVLAGLGIASGTARPIISTSSNSSSGGFNLK